jgi:serine/threonine-protein kinase
MGIVLVATHLQLQEKVALKVLDGQAAGESAAVTRFLREARAATRVKSEYVVRILDFGTFDAGEPYLVMELLEGRDLRDVLQESGPIPVPLAIDYVLQVCNGLAAAHALRIIHRDLKPANLFLAESPGRPPIVKVLDFGIAKALDPERLALVGQENQTLTHATQLLGSPVYMSPEQIRCSTKVDERSDVWSLGIILHELVTGATPFTASTISGLLATIAADAPLSLRSFLPDAPAALESVILGCLEKDLDRRIPSVAVLAERLRAIAAFLREGGTRVELVTFDVPPRRQGRGRATALALGAALAFAAALFAWLRREPPRSPTLGAASTVHELVPAAPQVPVATTAEPIPAPPTSVEPPPTASSDPKHKKPIRRKPAAETPHAAPPPADYETSATERRK